MSKIKTLGLAAVAALAFSALASATTGTAFLECTDLDDRRDSTRQVDPTFPLAAGGDITAAARNQLDCGTPLSTVTGRTNNERKLIHELGKRDKSLT
jgi:hypothetical protein